MKTILRVLAFTLVLILIFTLISCSKFDTSSSGEDVSGFNDISVTDNEYIHTVGPFEVKYVIDGDTFVIHKDNEDIKVRLIGINTPESVASDESRNNKYGKIASSYTKELLNGESVYLEYDVEKQDKYGRDLAYVYFEDGTMLNFILVKNGYAQTMEIAPNTKHAKEFKEAEIYAQNYDMGFWAEAGEGIYK